MNRLTKYICGAAHGKCGRTIEEASKAKKYCRGKFEATGCIDKLAQYEDTGLEPDEIQHWVPCSERLPETGETNSHKFDVLVYVPKRDGCHQSGYFIGKLHKVEADNTGNTNFWGVKTPGSEWTLWGWSYFEEPIPSHWMPLPQSPKEEK